VQAFAGSVSALTARSGLGLSRCKLVFLRGGVHQPRRMRHARRRHAAAGLSNPIGGHC